MNCKSDEVLRQPSKRRRKQRKVSALETDQLSSKKGSQSLWHQSTALFQEIPSNLTELLGAQPSPGNHLGHLSWQCLNLRIWKMEMGRGGEKLSTPDFTSSLLPESNWVHWPVGHVTRSLYSLLIPPVVLDRMKWSCIYCLGIFLCCQHSVNKALF